MGFFEKLPQVSDTKTLAPLLGTTERHLEDMRTRGEGPPCFRVGRKVRYDRDAVKAWIEANSTVAA
jgi:excisionase family DNA binding protein